MVGFGYLLALQFGLSTGAHHHAHHEHKKQIIHKESDIKLIEVGKDVVFDFELVQDDTEDWSIFLETKDFKFAPANIGKAHVLGEGYAYLFIDGVKHSRIYSNWHHLGPLKYGSEIRITLNSNDHRTYSKKGMPVERVYILEDNKEN